MPTTTGATVKTAPRSGRIVVLPGDHIGPEVVTEALKVLDIV